MSVGILIITHGETAQQLILTATSTLGGELPLDCRALSVSPTCDPDKSLKKAESLLNDLMSEDGVLILTDIYGSTPSNIANHFERLENISVIAGINLPMLIRVLNYPKLSLPEMTEKALSGGHDGIILCDKGQS